MTNDGRFADDKRKVSWNEQQFPRFRFRFRFRFEKFKSASRSHGIFTTFHATAKQKAETILKTQRTIRQTNESQLSIDSMSEIQCVTKCRDEEIEFNSMFVRFSTVSRHNRQQFFDTIVDGGHLFLSSACCSSLLHSSEVCDVVSTRRAHQNNWKRSGDMQIYSLHSSIWASKMYSCIERKRITRTVKRFTIQWIRSMKSCATKKKNDQTNDRVESK